MGAFFFAKFKILKSFTLCCHVYMRCSAPNLSSIIFLKNNLFLFFPLSFLPVNILGVIPARIRLFFLYTWCGFKRYATDFCLFADYSRMIRTFSCSNITYFHFVQKEIKGLVPFEAFLRSVFHSAFKSWDWEQCSCSGVQTLFCDCLCCVGNRIWGWKILCTPSLFCRKWRIFVSEEEWRESGTLAIPV